MAATVLITGANGFIGSYLTLLFESLGHRVVPVDIDSRFHDLSLLPIKLSTIKLDVADAKAFHKLCKNHRVTHMIHSVHPLEDENPELLSASLHVMQNVMEAARVLRVQRVVFASSGLVYGQIRKKEPRLVKEDELVAIYPAVLSRSGMILGEWLGDYYDRRHGVSFVALRISTVYGPGQKDGIGAAIRDGVLGRKCLPTLSRVPDDLIYVKDVVRALQIACFYEQPVSRAYNIASEKAYDQGDLENAMRKYLPEVSFEIGQAPEGDAENQFSQRHLLDVKLARRELEFFPQFDLESGVAAIAAWVRSDKRRLR